MVVCWLSMNLLPAQAGNVGSIIGIDPGSETLGLCVMHIDVTTFEIIETTSKTYIGSKLGMSKEIASIFGDKFARIEAHKQNIISILCDVNPISIVCESPFYNSRRPSAFAALTEVVCAIRYACFEYSRLLSLELVDPPTAKIATGAKGNAKKEQVQEAILRLNNLNYVGDVSLDKLDEHSIDAIAIAYWKYRKLKENFDKEILKWKNPVVIHL